jgi:hypothetical protein
MPLPLKAVTLDIRTFLADNNIRRNVAAFSINYGSQSESVSQSSFVLAASAIRTIASQIDPCVVTVLQTSIPLSVNVTVKPTDPLLPLTVFTVVVSKLLILDSNVQSLTLTNLSTTETAKVSLQQG